MDDTELSIPGALASNPYMNGDIPDSPA